ncbi:MULTISPECIES: YceI family protein [Chryseobacterium]|uniref:Protein YceI n=1 Tax=Chryseobacterium salivictor TaxID=2547600 RepID=A0A4P6ZH98_9FLAO|nr:MULTISPECIES: YceI family protein [Chryseobacterium]MDQ0475513.1 polyisoprenoid-binding protein YceI [Chryseobacterium sp. MDT2-18]QBO58937.1 Protein YceI [Chryseobacterium salivictor]
MKNLVLAALLAGGMMFGQTKKVTDSNIEWWGYKLAKTEASSHNGVVNLKSGDVVMKGNNIVGGTFSLDMNSINATDLSGEYQTKLNNHLKTGDFFETDKFPVATYKITSVKKNSNKAFPYMIYGNLTAKNKTNPVAFPAKISLKNGVLNIVSDKFSFDRQKFDIAYASAAKDVIVKDEIDMIINVTAK